MLKKRSKQPYFSIITPSLNQGQFIEQAIKSVLKQNYPSFEHIVIDGLSTDNTLQILGKYKHLKWISEPDDNCVEAVNKGVTMVVLYLWLWSNSGWVSIDKEGVNKHFIKVVTMEVLKEKNY